MCCVMLLVTARAFSCQGGMADSLETLCGQAFGAARHHLLGVYKQRAMVVLSLVSLPGGGGLGLHRRDPSVVRPGPGDRRGGGELHPVADPGAVRVRAAAVPQPVPADAERRRAGDAELRRHGRDPRGRLLAAGAQAQHGQQWRGAGHGRILPRQPVHPGALRQALPVLQGHVAGVLPGGVPWHRRLPEARRAVGSHGPVRNEDPCFHVVLS